MLHRTICSSAPFSTTLISASLLQFPSSLSFGRHHLLNKSQHEAANTRERDFSTARLKHCVWIKHERWDDRGEEKRGWGRGSDEMAGRGTGWGRKGEKLRDRVRKWEERRDVESERERDGDNKSAVNESQSAMQTEEQLSLRVSEFLQTRTEQRTEKEEQGRTEGEGRKERGEERERGGKREGMLINKILSLDEPRISSRL